jgi:hypothetical protein
LDRVGCGKQRLVAPSVAAWGTESLVAMFGRHVRKTERRRALFSAPFLPEPCEINDDDLARLSPLQHEHIKMLGTFHSALPDELTAGQRHTLRTNDDRGA